MTSALVEKWRDGADQRHRETRDETIRLIGLQLAHELEVNAAAQKEILTKLLGAQEDALHAITKGEPLQAFMARRAEETVAALEAIKTQHRKDHQRRPPRAGHGAHDAGGRGRARRRDARSPCRGCGGDGRAASGPAAPAAEDRAAFRGCTAWEAYLESGHGCGGRERWHRVWRIAGAWISRHPSRPGSCQGIDGPLCKRAPGIPPAASARLHAGEMVLPQRVAEVVRRGSERSSRPVQITNHFTVTGGQRRGHRQSHRAADRTVGALRAARQDHPGQDVMAELFTNNAATTVASGLNNTTNPVTFTVASATAFPATGNFRILVGNELLLVTARAGTSFTATRGHRGDRESRRMPMAPR